MPNRTALSALSSGVLHCLVIFPILAALLCSPAPSEIPQVATATIRLVAKRSVTPPHVIGETSALPPSDTRTVPAARVSAPRPTRPKTAPGPVASKGNALKSPLNVKRPGEKPKSNSALPSLAKLTSSPAYPSAASHSSPKSQSSNEPQAEEKMAGSEPHGSSGARPAAQALGPEGEGVVGDLSPPVMLKGPENIPVPPSLRGQGGHFVIALRCEVALDGSSQTSVQDSTGAIELDETLCRAFSNLPWYPAESGGKPVAVPVRLKIEASWESGDTLIQWKGRRPKA